MSPASSFPGYSVQRGPAPADPSPLRTDIAGFAGRTTTGEAGKLVAIGDADDFTREFGPPPRPDGGADSSVATAVRGYFDNGGQRAFVVRVAGPVDGEPPGPQEYWAAATALSNEAQVSLVGLPDVWDTVDEPYELIARVAVLMQGTLDQLLVLSLPPQARASAADAADAVTALERALERAQPATAARAVAVYHPWVVIVADDGRPLVVPPAGHVLGLFSRLDRELGPSRSPANAPLVGVVDLDERSMRSTQPGGSGPVPLAGRRVNPIRVVPGRGLQVWGARTFDPAPGARFVAHRRLLHRLIRAARAAAEPLVFEPQGPDLRRALVRAVTTVLLQAYRSGALAGRTASEAFQVRCDAATTPAGDSGNGRLVCELAFTPADPMEEITVLLNLGPEGRLEVIEQ